MASGGVDGMVTMAHSFKSGRVFISYRREDSAYPAGWLFDRLAGHVGPGRVFKDVDSIRLGDDFVEKITTAVKSSAVLLAVIGVRWLEARDKNGRRRLDDPEDFVRLEIETALEHRVRIIPVLVDGAQMPPEAELPLSLQRLVRLQAIHLNPDSFGADTHDLLGTLDEAFAASPAGEGEPPDWLLSLDRFARNRLAPINWRLVLTVLTATLATAFGVLAYFTTTT
jgi:TIR domain